MTWHPDHERDQKGQPVRLAQWHALARRLLDPEDLGYAVSAEVRQLVREALAKDGER